MIEVSDFFTQDEIFQQRRTAVACFQRVLIVVDANALIGGEKLAAAVFSVLLQVVPLVVVVRRQFCGMRFRVRLMLCFGRLFFCVA